MARFIEGRPMKGKVSGQPSGFSERSNITPDHSLCRAIPRPQVVEDQKPKPSKTK